MVHSYLGNGCCAVCSGLWMAGKMGSVREAWENGTLSWGGVGYARQEVLMSVVRIESMGEGVRIMWSHGTLSDGRG